MPCWRCSIVGEDVADRPPGRQRTLRLEYQFDRLLAEKLAHAYELLVPDQVRPTAQAGAGRARRRTGASE